MAGLATYGDLTEALADPGPIICTHSLKSVKSFTSPILTIPSFTAP